MESIDHLGVCMCASPSPSPPAPPALPLPPPPHPPFSTRRVICSYRLLSSQPVSVGPAAWPDPPSSLTTRQQFALSPLQRQRAAADHCACPPSTRAGTGPAWQARARVRVCESLSVWVWVNFVTLCVSVFVFVCFAYSCVWISVIEDETRKQSSGDHSHTVSIFLSFTVQVVWLSGKVYRKGIPLAIRSVCEACTSAERAPCVQVVGERVKRYINGRYYDLKWKRGTAYDCK